MGMSALERQFQAAMFEIYETASEFKYYPHNFRTMVMERGGLETAKYLIKAPGISYGFTKLWSKERMDVTVECLILDSRWDDLFTEEERSITRRRLKDAECDKHCLSK